MKYCLTTLAAGVCLATAAIAAPGRTGAPTELVLPDIQVPATKYVLANGLTLIVHEDHTAPLVAVNIWYHVGSKNEPKGRSGFAHLFEHLMFNGSENYNDDFFKLTQKIGATQQNGTTSEDRTNYFQTVPTNALDTILWLESDRMGHLLGAIDQGKLDEQRKVVQNEKRQGDNRPYAKAEDLIIRATMPMGHPYDHSVIGAMEDLNAASLEDVKEWFRTYYGASNAVLVLAGDITPEEAKIKVERYFGDIAPGTPIAHPQAWVAKRTGTQREVAYDRVAQPRFYRVWNMSEHVAVDTDYLQFLGLVLAGDKNARLHKRLVIDEQLATHVEAYAASREIGGLFRIVVTGKHAKDLPLIEQVVDRELRKLIATGPTPAEMSRLRTAFVASQIRGLEQLGGFGGRAALLAESETFHGSPDGWREGFLRFKTATPAHLQAAAKKWLTDGDYVLTVLPFGEHAVAAAGADRKALPMPTNTAAASFPLVERATLANGMKLVVARRGAVPLVNMTLVVDTGAAEDFATVAPGTDELTMALLNEGTKRRSGPQLVDALGKLGATLQTTGGREHVSVSLSALTSALTPALELFAEVITQPSFPENALNRVKAQASADIAARRQDPTSAVRRLLARLIFGADAANGRLTTSQTVASIGRPQVVAFHDRWFHPNNATVVVAGDTSLAQVKPLIESAFAGWKSAPVPPTTAPLAADATRTKVYLLDRPGTPQAVIRAAVLAPPRLDGNEVAREALNVALGGSFISRLNMKLREEKGWAYGAGSSVVGDGQGSRIFTAGASVQTDKAAESMAEIVKVLRSITSDRAILPEELVAAKDYMTLGLSSDWSTSHGIAEYLIDEASARLPDDYYPRYAHNINAVTLEEINAAATSLIGQRPMTWVVAGDLTRIESGIRALKLGEVAVLDADGNIVR